MNLRNPIVATLASVALFALLAPSAALAAQSAEPEKCDKTWFPDFRCPDRQGRYDGFIMPISQPFYFEDPFITTGANLFGVWHEFRDDSVFNGGDAWVLALQLRVALTDRLAFIATKDGYTWVRPDDTSAVEDRGGWNNLSFGFKYAAVDRREDNLIISPTFRFEVPSGQRSVFQNWGKGVGIPGISYAWGYEKFHIIGDIGAQLPFDWDVQTSSLFWHFHFDYALFKHFVPLLEIGGIHYTSSGNGSLPVDTVLGTVPLTVAQGVTGVGPFEGHDVANLGSRGVKGETVATLAVGAQFPITEHVFAGAVYEFPISDTKWIFDQRVTFEVSYEF